MSTKTKSGVPVSIFTLSDQGLQETESHSDTLYRYPELDPYKINQQLIRHDLLAQLVTVNALNAGVITGYETERMFSQDGDKSGVKRPDVVWVTPSDTRIAVEIELSGKWERDLDEFILRIIRALQSSEGSPAKYNRFAIISDSRAIIKRYKDAIKPGASLSIWKKNQRKHWVVEKTLSVPDWLITKVDFRLIEKKKKNENE